MSLETYTLFHVVISLVGIASGLVVLYGLLTARRLDAWTLVFLTTTVATSVTGFGFPFREFLPSHAVGIISLIVVAIAIPARYVWHLVGSWRWIYVVGAVLALYLNVFVLVVQIFLKVPIFNALAPTQTEPPFLFAQATAAALFVSLGALAVRQFRVQPAVVPSRRPVAGSHAGS
ncbi:MAG TPA: hypothetical protein VGC53_14850 [Vicinamibacteria bacterium]